MPPTELTLDTIRCSCAGPWSEHAQACPPDQARHLEGQAAGGTSAFTDLCLVQEFEHGWGFRPQGQGWPVSGSVSGGRVTSRTRGRAWAGRETPATARALHTGTHLPKLRMRLLAARPGQRQDGSLGTSGRHTPRFWKLCPKKTTFERRENVSDRERDLGQMSPLTDGVGEAGQCHSQAPRNTPSFGSAPAAGGRRHVHGVSTWGSCGAPVEPHAGWCASTSSRLGTAHLVSLQPVAQSFASEPFHQNGK